MPNALPRFLQRQKDIPLRAGIAAVLLLLFLPLCGCGASSSSTGQSAPAAPTSSPGPGMTSLASSFTSTLQNVFFLTEGQGTVVKDSQGGQTAVVASGGTVTWSAHGGIVFDGGFTNRFEAQGVTSFLTVEVVFSPSLPGSQTYSMPVCYGGMASPSGLQPCLELSGTWHGSAGQGATLNSPTYSAYHYCCDSNTADVGSTTVINTGVHVMTLVLVPNGAGHVYVDGTEVTDYSSTPVFNQSGLANGFLEFGGSPLVYINCPTSTCGFNGIIYGVATYSSSLGPADVQHDYGVWQTVLSDKGVNPKQVVYSNNNNGRKDQPGRRSRLSRMVKVTPGVMV